MISNTYFQKVITAKQVPTCCPFCFDKGMVIPTLISAYSVECSDMDNCDYYQEIEEETDESTVYDHSMGIIIK